MNLSGFVRKTAHGALLLPRRHRLLREKRGYQGDLSASINDALLAGNLNDLTIGQVLLVRKASIYRQQHVERRCFRLFEKFTILSPANPAYRAV